MSIANNYNDFKREIELLIKQNPLECELYSIVATIIRERDSSNWVMDKLEVYQRITNNLQRNGTYLYEITLTCTEEALTNRWHKDNLCEWRIEEWLNVSKKSLNYFNGLDTICIDTSDITAMDVADEIYSVVIK